jgi:hypothetical protein
VTARELVRHLEPSQRSAKDFIRRGIAGSVIMLNLLRLRVVADYSDSPKLAPESPISGAEAFNLYIVHTLPFLHESGGDLLFLGAGGEFLIDPEHEKWDLVMMVRQSNVQSFLTFATNHDYLTGLGHRTAAIDDSRLLPMTELPVPA